MAVHKHPGDSNGTARGEGIDGLFSKLEASFAETKVVPRQNSIEMKDVNRHAQALDVTENDLDYNFDLEVDKYPLSELQSLHEVFPAILYTTHLSNLNNFSSETDVECFDSMNAEAGVHRLDHHGLKNVLKVNKVDDHLGGLGTNDTNRLSELTKSLQIISQQADSHLLNADVAIITAKAILDAHRKLHATLSTPERAQQQATDSISYVISSMEKQRMLFTNYKNRKDSTMSLVYNLVTQRDAANNIEMTADMKRDSTSMNAIAALTMVFLPGTFTASVMSAGIFSSVAHSRDISVSGIWWLWLVITLPLTVAVTACWWLYKRRKDVAKLKAPWTALLTRSRIDEPHEV
ncbi:MAG: hypothetical protein M1821_000575 [Bathelium mastoideum]|nr:MAG: hypothetical protein M1821_000575 [Bathelium mastoideum]